MTALLTAPPDSPAGGSILRVPERPGFEHLPVIQRPHVVAEEIIDQVARYGFGLERNVQTAIGPSEIGHVCDRFILRRLAGQKEPRGQVPWRASVGTAMHLWLEGGFTADRWLTETRLHIGDAGHRRIEGSCDLFDTATLQVWDWKTTSRTQLDQVRLHGPKPKNRTQAHCYGRGWELRGMRPTSVGNVYLMRDGELRDTHVWYEPYDPAVAEAALERLGRLAAELDTFGLDVALALHPDYCDEEHCRFCQADRPVALRTVDKIFG